MKVYLMQRKGQLSEKRAKNGKRRMNSLYLAYHFGSGKKRQYEFLNLYLYDKPKTSLEREHNRETQNLAEAIRARKVLEAQSSEHGFVSSAMGKISFLDFFRALADRKWDSNGNHGNWLSAYKHLKIFCNGQDYTLNQIDDRFIEGFKDYLLTKAVKRDKRRLSQNTRLSYFSKLVAALNEAFIKRLIKENPAVRVKGIKAGDTHREFLTLEELQTLVNTDCEIPIIKNAFLFSALTGLRWSDVQKLRWSDIHFIENEGWFIKFTQKKTKGAEMLPISEQALKFAGERQEDSLLFEGLVYSGHNNDKLKLWVLSAGIKKKITFHCARHSFATLQLSMNTDIYTVSKLLGHKHLKTTEIYAKVIDKRKIEAANRIPEIAIKSLVKNGDT